MIIVTGANGFIGSALIRHLNKMGRTDIVAVDIVPPNERPRLLTRAQFLEFVLYPEFLNWLQKPHTSKIEVVFHMGAISSTTENDWDRLVTHNIELSQKLYEFCQDGQIPFLYASSAAVYGDGKKGFNDQNDTSIYEPLNLYGRSKKVFDIWIQNQNSRIPWYGFRFFNVYGPNEYYKDNMASVAYKAYLQIKRDGQLKLFRTNSAKFKDGQQLRDFVYIKDICHWMWQFYSLKPTNGVYNLGFGKANTWLELAEYAFAQMKLPMQIEWIDIPEHIRSQYQNFTEAQMDKSFSVGIDRPQYDLRAGIFDYYKNYLLTDEPYL